MDLGCLSPLSITVVSSPDQSVDGDDNYREEDFSQKAAFDAINRNENIDNIMGELFKESNNEKEAEERIEDPIEGDKEEEFNKKLQSWLSTNNYLLVDKSAVFGNTMNVTPFSPILKEFEQSGKNVDI